MAKARRRRGGLGTWLRSGALRTAGAAVGIAGTAATGMLVWASAVGTPPPDWPAAALAAALTAALTACCLLGALVLDLDSSKRVTTETLLRQRRLMLARTRALRDSRERFESLFRHVPAAILVTDASGTIVAANPAMCALLGVASEDELRPANFRDFYADPAERDRLVRGWESGRHDTWKVEVKLRRRDGREISVVSEARLIRNERGRVESIEGMFTDVTALRRAEAERRTLETHLRLSQKLESVGRLAAGVAHEINSPMQVLGDNVHFLKRAFATFSDVVDSYQRILDRELDGECSELARGLHELASEAELPQTLEAAPGALKRAGDNIDAVNRIVAALTELAHPKQGVKTRTDVNALVETALVVTRNEYKTVARVDTDFADVPSLLLQKNELCQVLINLVINSAHAIESATRQDGRRGVIRVVTRVEGDAVAIRVADNGCGIPRAALDKVFDPFFTTKDVGRGTGQGLAIARSMVVDKHGGDIGVDSTPGVGATFTIKLPLEQQRSDEHRAVKEMKSWPTSR